jgi:hypothetical protein
MGKKQRRQTNPSKKRHKRATPKQIAKRKAKFQALIQKHGLNHAKLRIQPSGIDGQKSNFINDLIAKHKMKSRSDKLSSSDRKFVTQNQNTKYDSAPASPAPSLPELLKHAFNYLSLHTGMTRDQFAAEYKAGGMTHINTLYEQAALQRLTERAAGFEKL